MTKSAETTLRRDRLQAIGFTLCLWILLLVPGDSVQHLPGRFDFLIPPHSDKLIHCSLFILECFFLFRYFRHLPGSAGRSGRDIIGMHSNGLGATWISAGLLAFATEGSQAWVPNRLADPLDVVADIVGIALWTLGMAIAGRNVRCT